MASPVSTSAAPSSSREVTRYVAIAGNPNCGKSTIFNALTGLRQKVGNYPGVTVEKKTGRFFGSHGEAMELLDLPGSYSLQVRSPDEAVARDVLLGRQADTPRPDAIICVVDASNLERNLYLVAQMLELNIPIVVALNMVDVAEKNGVVIDIMALREKLGVPVIAMVATKGVGLIELRQAVSRSPLPPPTIWTQMPIVLEREVMGLARQLPVAPDIARAEALLLLTLHEAALDEVTHHDRAIIEATKAAQQRLGTAGIDPISAPVDARYDWIGQVCAAAHHTGDSHFAASVSDKVDGWLTHRVWGWVAFLGMMALMFFCIFTVAQVPMDWIKDGSDWLGKWVTDHLPESDLRGLLTDGVIAGVGGVVVFLPQILILYFFLGILEDTGYMARAAFIMDRLMSKAGLHGKSFIPMLSSFACAIPGIMATRTIENRKDRLVTILVAPLMSCSARLPVYSLMIAVLIPGHSAMQKAGIMLCMYLLGIFVAFGMAWVFKRKLLKGETPMLLLEMPPYRMPSWKGVALRMWERSGLFMRRAGTVILALSVLLWALATYPKPSDPKATPSEALAQSFAGRMGHAIEPAIKPLGYDWKIGIGLIGSFAAREVFVGTMSIVYSVESKDKEDIAPLRDTMTNEKRNDGSPMFTPLVCIGLMVFYVLAMQCISTVAVVRRETNSWRWPLFQIFYMTGLAWAGAFIVYQGGKLLGFH
ncbi:ferrous iron transport protein B [Chthoniobacter flavus Ellin428]|uniref:Ferrous iron transport protein B n=1 Tax=Chthoniobacter flavus Ellin428 TaxID=497964 RepID=B4DBS9_9BACT|nr:ferrous iron transport protein B [Chthoniobacter flavus]EDY16108.1 ferrous iron transport protein B [Chthoniobacter flavus Ellin428]TCO83962.1 ferrous iron transport protein B [Chthoniobacter flavus]